MKKPIVIFIIGMIVGATLLAIGYLIAANIDYDTTEYFKTAGECREDIGTFMVKEQISKDKVFAYVNCGNEITFVADLIGIDEDHFPMALLITPNKKSYYDNEIIEVPSGKCARQIGVYTMYRDGTKRTIPIFRIE